jgi:hypothetical protein
LVELAVGATKKGDIRMSAAEINAKRIEQIIVTYDFRTSDARAIARRIVEEFSVLRPLQQTSERDGSSRVIFQPVPWK